MGVDKESTSRKDITKALSDSVEKLIDPNNDPRIYYAKEVSFDCWTESAIRVDYMKFKQLNTSISGIEKGDFYCYEVKSSVADFKSKNGHNFIGDYNYYVMPRDVFDKVKDEIPYYIGVYCPSGEVGSPLKSVKRANRKDRERPVSEMLLMMFRSYKRDWRK